jgi:predicted DNA-binding transcriptional regulator YafY
MERKRLIVDRFRRLWAIVEFIAAHPGCSRGQLAEHFALSERQLQADLNVIRLEMGLPLVRRQGYRFLDDGDQGPPPLALADAEMLGVALRQAAASGAIAPAAMRSLTDKLPALFPCHLRPFLVRALPPMADDGVARDEDDVMMVVVRAIESRSPLRLRYGGERNAALLAEPVVEPELLVPYRGSWYLIGYCEQRGRALMFCLDAVSEAVVLPMSALAR